MLLITIHPGTYYIIQFLLFLQPSHPNSHQKDGRYIYYTELTDKQWHVPG